ncbi:ornithine decarboxylase antizyme [Diplocarpon rosae]|nr:ornithine decarboxylase antizyme [Diplocarpon rosae]
MSPSKNNSHSTSNCHGELVSRQASILASAYCVDSSARLSGFHYFTTGDAAARSLTPLQGQSGIPEVGTQGLPSPPSSPPLAALTSANELALISKIGPNRKRETDGKRRNRKEGAAHYIREECERLFCETMKDVFFGEGGLATNNGSIVMDANTYSPPDDSVNTYNDYFVRKHSTHRIDAWLEIWDYVGGCSLRGFVGGDGDKKSLFAFFDSTVVERDLKQGSLMALIELAETVFAVTQVVLCLDRSVPEIDRRALLKSLRWVGFELISLTMWTNDLDVTSEKWLFLGMEV